MGKAASLWGAALVGAAVLALSGCSAAESRDTTIIRVAFNQSESHPEYIAMTEFGKKFSEATNGKYEVQIYPNAIVSAPYLYDNTAQLLQAAKEGVFDTLFETTKKFNFEVVSLYTSGARAIYTDKPILTPADLAGYKIRVQDSDTYIRMINLMGGVGIAMAQSEVYTATQQKVIEGGENSERVYMDFKHYEVAPYFSYTNHLVMADTVIANRKFVEDMDEETREIFYRLMDESMEREFQLMDESVKQGRQDAEEKGAQFVYPDVEEFEKRCQPLLEEIADQSQVTRDIYDRVQKIKEEMEVPKA